MKELLVVASLYLFSIHVVGISLNLPKVIEVTEMDDVSIPCNVTDYAGNMTLIKFNWMKSMAILQSGQILRIPIISSDKSGTYTCYATIEGQTYNSSVSILVSYAPRWIEGALRKFSGAFGSSATLTCLVDSYPSPLFTWIGTDNVSLISSSSKYIIDNIAHKSDLMINSLAQNDYGSYTCGAENKAGKRIYKLQLLIPGKPDSPQTCETAALKSDSVTLTCVEGYKGGADQLDYMIEVYTTGSNLVTSNFISTRVNSTTISFEVKGLSPKHEYTLDIIASNGYGRSSEPFSLYFTTAPGAMLLTMGSSDNSKVVALAVCIPLLFIAIMSGSLVAMYKYYLKQKHAPQESEVLTFQQALSNFPMSDKSHQRRNSKELILGRLNDAATSSKDNSHINHAFVREESFNKAQPSLAGCGALEALRVIHAPAQLNFIPGKSSTTEVQEDLQCADARALPPSISDSWEFPRSEFFLKKKLGDGSFGEVWEARIESGQSGDGGRIVAVKMLRDNFTDDEQQSMLDDMKVMKSIGFHPNIIQLIGCCTSSYPLCMITEYASRGTLLSLLRQQRLFSGIKLSTKDIESFTLQIASAMEHATSLKLLHRDMACRSVLMSNDLVCKLADFEKELHFQDSDNLHRKKNDKIQMRWLPPESLFVKEKSVKSNIWSFGILIWECFTLGSTPYPGMNNKEVVDFIQRGGRMPKPNFCSQAMYEVVQDCWIYYPHKRASFCELRRKIQRIYETSPTQDMDFATGEYDSKSWNASPQDLGEFV